MRLRAGPWLLAALVLGAAALAAATTLLRGEAGALDRIRETGVIRIGYAVEAPYAMASDGQVTGEFPELAKLVVARMGVDEIEWVQADFESLIDDLGDGRFDVIAAGMFITPERTRSIAFSEPTLRVQTGLLVPAGNPRGLRSVDDVFAVPGLHVAVLAGSVEEDRVRARGIPPGALLRAPDAVSARAAVAGGIADVLVVSAPTTRAMARAQPALLESIEAPPGNPGPSVLISYVGFAFSMGDRGLVREWNRAQAAVLGSPAHLASMRRFGFDLADLPTGTTLEDVLHYASGDGPTRR
ncbi:MAG TPA: transporter substrate-binding domain-containing protein [Longimicrobiaceae bacterium]|nr:transporter substrate-binding domain-containing protein [Longimicrobiaceae bacterium]